MIFLLLFLVELVSLFFCSKLLIRALAGLFYHLTKSHRITVHLLAFLFLPGTLIHELSHVLAAGALLVPVGNFELMPEIREDGVKLGSAQIGKTDPLRRALIGVAPVFFGVSIIIGVLYYLSARSDVRFWIFLALFYILFEAANTMFSSKKDLEGTLEVGFLIVGLFAAFYLLKFDAVFLWIGEILTKYEAQIQKADTFLLVPVIFDLVVYGVVRFTLGRMRL
ncbi:hypothetical protein HYW46_05120 [Candidatus Daviesbacteria bacterium]|nr:hypothetical protein [Candidatus Daviesbacteria bacterium]